VLLYPDRDPIELSGGELESTNNRMELTAAIEALRALDGPHRVELFTDSTYLRSGITSWLEGWRRRGWRTGQGEPVKNQDLWQALDEAIGRHEITWQWVRGHAGNTYNELADRLASAAIPRPELPVDDPKAVHLYLGAAFSGTRRAGSWAAVLVFQEHEKVASGAVAPASSNQMHLVSAVEGLKALSRPVRVHVYTASDYLRDGATTWVKSWQRRGWRTASDSPVRHRDLWQELIRLARRHDVHWHVAKQGEWPAGLAAAKQHAREALPDEHE
jgi:ribonuclease HI